MRWCACGGPDDDAAHVVQARLDAAIARARRRLQSLRPSGFAPRLDSAQGAAMGAWPTWICGGNIC